MPAETNPLINNIQLDTQSYDLSSLESIAAIPSSNTNSNSQAFACSSTGLALSSVYLPQVRTCGTINEDLFNEGNDSDGEVGPFYDAVTNSKDITNESTPLVDIVAPTNSNNNPASQHAVEDIRKITVNELKKR